MDVKKIGAFIAQQRKQKQLTQKQLSVALGISDKTVSKWECGYGLPDISMITPLCAELEITVNELLSGEHLSQEDYHEKAEENMIQLMHENKKTTKMFRFKTIAGSVCIIAAGIVLASIYKANSYFITVNFGDTFRIAELLFFLIASLWTAGCMKDFGSAFFCLGRKPAAAKQLKYSVLAVSTAQKALLSGSAIIGILELILVFGDAEFQGTISALPRNLAEFFITLFYGVLCVLLLEPVKGRLKKKLIDIYDSI